MRSSPEAPEDRKRTRLTILVVFGLALVALYVTLGGPREAELWSDLPGPQIPDDDQVEQQAPESPDQVEDVELWLEPLALLAKDASSSGPAALVVESRAGRDPTACSLRIVEGRGAGRSAQVDGDAILRGLPEGSALIELERSGRRAVRYARLPARSPLLVDWGRRVTVRAQVSDSHGKALADATLVCGAREFKSDAQGRVVVPDVVCGSGLPISVAARAHTSVFEVHDVRGDLDLRFVLDDAWRIRGIVQLPRSQLAKARVAVLPVGQGAWQPWFWKGRLCDLAIDERGRFEVDGLSYDYESVAIGVLSGTHHQADAMLVDRPRSRTPGRNVVDVLVRGNEAPLCRGVVVDASARPLGGTEIVARHRSTPSWGSDWIVSMPQTPWPTWIARLGSCSTSTDASGRFTIALPFARTRVLASKLGFASEEQAVRKRRGQTLRFALAERASSNAAPRLALQRIKTISKPWLRVKVFWRKRLQGRAFSAKNDGQLEIPIAQACVVKLLAKFGGERLVVERLRIDGRTELELPR